jgi:hypothetical protein
MYEALYAHHLFHRDHNTEIIKFTLCLIKHQEHVWGRGDIDLHILNLRKRWRRVVSFKLTALYFRYPLDWRLDGYQSRSECDGLVNIFLFFFLMALQPFLGLWPHISVAKSFYTDGRTPWTSDQPVARPLPIHRTTQTRKNAQTYKHPCLE